MNNPILTVVIPAYNAEKYIEETIDSVLNQKTNFEYNIFIADDSSTDSTYEKCINYSLKYNNIKVIKHERNIGMTKNQHFVITYPTTKYIAYIDSDDVYIIDNYLQTQIDILENNPDVVVAFSNVERYNMINHTNEVKLKEKRIPPSIFNLHAYLKNTYSITNSTMVFRQSTVLDIPEFFVNYFQYDWLLHLHHGLKGNFYFNDIIAVRYRIHHENATNSKNYEKILNDAIKLVYYIKNYLPKEYHIYFKHPLYEINTLAFFYLKNKNYILFFKFYFKWLILCEKSKIKIKDEIWKFKNIIKNNE